MSLLILHNAKVATLDVTGLFAQAIVIDTSKQTIVETGTNEDILGRYCGAKVIDVGGRCVIPGLNDSHLHFIREGNHFALELRWDGVKSLKQGLEMIRQQAARTPDGQWIRVVGGWCEHQFDERRLPSLEEINEAAGNHPLFVLHLYDCAMVNRLGMKLLGYNRNTPNPPSGEIVRDANGDPTGVLIARPNAFLLYNTLDKLPKLSVDEQYSSTKAFARECNRFGLTSCFCPGGGFQRFPEDYGVVRKLDADNALTVRVAYSLFPQKPKHELEDFKRWSTMVKPGDGSPFLYHVGAGEMLAFSAADFEDFKEDRPDLPSEMEADLEPIVKFLASVKWPFRLHATYGESIERELALFERIEKTQPGSISSLRWFIDHAETISEREIQRIRALNGGIAIQHRMAFQGEYFIDRYGADAAALAPPIQSMLKHGLPVGAGTDGTRVATYNPWVSIAWLVNGKTVAGTQLYREMVSRTDALRMWTESNTWFTNEDGKKGVLEAGKLADLAVLNADYFTVPAHEIDRIESVLTILGGKIVYVQSDRAAEFGLQSETLTPVLPHWSPVNIFGGYQLAGSRAWPVQRVQSESMKEQHSEQFTQSNKSMPSDQNQNPSLQHSEFFMYGHDC